MTVPRLWGDLTEPTVGAVHDRPAGSHGMTWRTGDSAWCRRLSLDFPRLCAGVGRVRRCWPRTDPDPRRRGSPGGTEILRLGRPPVSDGWERSGQASTARPATRPTRAVATTPIVVASWTAATVPPAGQCRGTARCRWCKRPVRARPIAHRSSPSAPGAGPGLKASVRGIEAGPPRRARPGVSPDGKQAPDRRDRRGAAPTRQGRCRDDRGCSKAAVTRRPAAPRRPRPAALGRLRAATATTRSPIRITGSEAMPPSSG